MRYIDKYPNCNRCPVEKYCGTVVGSIKLCNSYNESIAQKQSHILTLSNAAAMEDDEIEERITMWDTMKEQP